MTGVRLLFSPAPSPLSVGSPVPLPSRDARGGRPDPSPAGPAPVQAPPTSSVGGWRAPRSVAAADCLCGRLRVRLGRQPSRRPPVRAGSGQLCHSLLLAVTPWRAADVTLTCCRRAPPAMTAGTSDAAAAVEVKPKGHAETGHMDEPVVKIDTANGDLSAPPPLQHDQPTNGERPVYRTLFFVVWGSCVYLHVCVFRCLLIVFVYPHACVRSRVCLFCPSVEHTGERRLRLHCVCPPRDGLAPGWQPAGDRRGWNAGVHRESNTSALSHRVGIHRIHADTHLLQTDFHTVAVCLWCRGAGPEWAGPVGGRGVLPATGTPAHVAHVATPRAARRSVGDGDVVAPCLTFVVHRMCASDGDGLHWPAAAAAVAAAASVGEGSPAGQAGRAAGRRETGGATLRDAPPLAGPDPAVFMSSVALCSPRLLLFMCAMDAGADGMWAGILLSPHRTRSGAWSEHGLGRCTGRSRKVK